MKPKVIASEQNQVFKDLRRLLSSRGIHEQGRALVAGDKVVPEVAAQHPGLVEIWITPEGGSPPPWDVPWVVLAPRLFAELDQFGTGAPLVVVTVPPIPAFADADPWPEGCTLFLALQNPDNVGAVVRTAAAFGVARIVLLQEAAHPFHPKAMRAAGTPLLAMPFSRGPALRDLSLQGAPLFALDAGGTNVAATRFPPRFGLLPGSEGPGLPAGLRVSARLSIPMAPGVESLNAATATAIALYEWRRS